MKFYLTDGSEVIFQVSDPKETILITVINNGKSVSKEIYYYDILVIEKIINEIKNSL